LLVLPNPAEAPARGYNAPFLGLEVCEVVWSSGLEALQRLYISPRIICTEPYDGVGETLPNPPKRESGLVSRGLSQTHSFIPPYRAAGWAGDSVRQ
jgi:hypothetical protein